MLTAKEHVFCVNCGNELPSSYTANYCPNCGQPIREENKIAKYTSDGKPVDQRIQSTPPNTEPRSDSPAIGTPKEISNHENTPAYTPGIKCLRCGARGVKLVRGKEYYELCEKCKMAEDEGKIRSSHGHGKAIGALIAIIIIAAIIAAIVNWLYQQGVETDKLLELGCDPEAWDRFGMVTIWSCPAWRDIDVNDPKTFMDQSPAGPNR